MLGTYNGGTDSPANYTRYPVKGLRFRNTMLVRLNIDHIGCQPIGKLVTRQTSSLTLIYRGMFVPSTVYYNFILRRH